MLRIAGRLTAFLCYLASAVPATRIGAQASDSGAVAPTAGQRVDIGGGQQLYLHCVGAGSPTVLFENGAGDFSVVWALVQPRVATFTRTCSYDRGGYLWSDPGSRPRTYQQLALELHTALERAGIAPPYVLVGQSYGGLVVRGFAKRYPHEVVGMVLVDAVHEDERIVYGGEPHRLRDQARGRTAPEPRIALDTQFVRLARDSAAITVEGALPFPLDRLPMEAQQRWRWAAGRPLYRMAWAAEMDWSPEELARMHDDRLARRASLGSMPLVVLARTNGGYESGMSISPDSLERERRRLMADLAALSTRGRLNFAAASGHNIHLEQPELVVTAIRDVVRGGSRRRRGP